MGKRGGDLLLIWNSLFKIYYLSFSLEVLQLKTISFARIVITYLEKVPLMCGSVYITIISLLH